MNATIDLYPGDLSLEGIPAEFSVEKDPGDPQTGDAPCIWATLEHIQIGGLILDRNQVISMAGVFAVCNVEKDMSEKLTMEGGV